MGEAFPSVGAFLSEEAIFSEAFGTFFVRYMNGEDVSGMFYPSWEEYMAEAPMRVSVALPASTPEIMLSSSPASLRPMV